MVLWSGASIRSLSAWRPSHVCHVYMLAAQSSLEQGKLLGSRYLNYLLACLLTQSRGRGLPSVCDLRCWQVASGIDHRARHQLRARFFLASSCDIAGYCRKALQRHPSGQGSGCVFMDINDMLPDNIASQLDALCPRGDACATPEVCLD